MGSYTTQESCSINCERKAKKAKKVFVKQNIFQLLVLIAGTTDAINEDDHGTRAKSYGDIENYWDSQFLKEVEHFIDEHNIKQNNLKLFPFHGWTGDNQSNNREVAGAFLVNKLCGAGGQSAFYEEKYQNKEIHFHLLGHSHGGNVINEMTKQMHNLGDKWPSKWKVKSITYLSTPFFKKLHQIKVTEKIFHKDAKVFHMYNDYDLTQRMLADFSLESFAGILHRIDKKPLLKQIEEISGLLKNLPIAHLSKFHNNTFFEMSHADGAKLFNSTIEIFESAKDIFKELLNLLKALNKPFKFIVSSILKNENILNTRQIIPNNLLGRFEIIIYRLSLDMDTMINDLRRYVSDRGTNRSLIYNKKDWVGFLFGSHLFVRHLSEFIDIKYDSDDVNKLNVLNRDSLWNLLYLILEHNIKEFDNTYANPLRQFKGSLLENQISKKNITSRDQYDGKIGSNNFSKFIERIEESEDIYEDHPKEPSSILNLIFILLANDHRVEPYINELKFSRDICDIAEYIVTGELDASVRQVRHMLTNIHIILEQRNVGGLLDTSHSLINEEVLQRGSLSYFLIESHSTSRRSLHMELKDFLQQVTSQ